MITWQRAFAVVGIAVGYLAMIIGFSLITFAFWGDNQPPVWVDPWATSVMGLPLAPVSYLVNRMGGGLNSSYLFLAAYGLNGLFWGVVIVSVSVWQKKRKARMAAAKAL